MSYKTQTMEDLFMKDAEDLTGVGKSIYGNVVRRPGEDETNLGMTVYDFCKSELTRAVEYQRKRVVFDLVKMLFPPEYGSIMIWYVKSDRLEDQLRKTVEAKEETKLMLKELVSELKIGVSVEDLENAVEEAAGNRIQTIANRVKTIEEQVIIDLYLETLTSGKLVLPQSI